jgi:chromosome segregation ATPase
MAEITNADLNALGDRLTRAIEREVGLAREASAKDIRGVYHRIDELKRKQDEQNGRVNMAVADIAALKRAQEASDERQARTELRVDDHATDISALQERTRNVSPALGLSLTRKHKSIIAGVLVSAAAGLTGVAKDIVLMIVSMLTGERTAP